MFIQSAKSQLERLLELNARTHLRELPQGRSYRVSGNGCILRRRGNEAAQNVAAGNRDMEAEQSHTDKGIPRFYENITLCHLNVCGWTKSNEQLRIGITNEINPDIFSLNETHLGESQIINVEGYSWKGFNRTCVHKDAPKASRRALAS